MPKSHPNSKSQSRPATRSNPEPATAQKSKSESKQSSNQEQQSTNSQPSNSRSSKGTNENHEKGKDLNETKKLIESMTVEKMYEIVCQENSKTFEKFKDSEYINAMNQIYNIFMFLKHKMHFFSSSTLYDDSLKKDFAEIVHKTITDIENSVNYNDFLQKSQNNILKLENISNQYNFETVSQAFDTWFSYIYQVVDDISQSNFDSSKTHYGNNFKGAMKNIKEIFRDILLNFKVLTNVRKIQVFQNFHVMLNDFQKDISNFLFDSEISTDSIHMKSSELFNSVIKLLLYLKFSLIIIQFIEFIIQTISDNNETNMLYDNEIIQFKLYQQLSDNSSLINNQEFQSKIYDFHLDLTDGTDFLKSFNQFSKTLTINMTEDDFNIKIKEFQNNNISYGLDIVLFKMFYYHQMISFLLPNLLSLSLPESFEQSRSIQNLYIKIQKFTNKFEKMKGEKINLDSVMDLNFNTLKKIIQTFKEKTILSTYLGVSFFFDMKKYIKLFQKEITTLYDTLFARYVFNKYASQDDSTSQIFVLNYTFYQPPAIKDLYDGSNIQQFDIKKEYIPILLEINNSLLRYGFSLLQDPPSYIVDSQNNKNFFINDVFAPNLCEIFKVFLNFNYNKQIKKLIKYPSSNNNLSSLVQQIHKELIKDTQSNFQLKEALAVHCLSYFFLLTLSASGALDFSDSMNLMYFKTSISILFGPKFFGNISLTTHFDISSNRYYKSMIKYMKENVNRGKIECEISYFRLFLSKLITTIMNLSGHFALKHKEIIFPIINWIIDPSVQSNKAFFIDDNIFQIQAIANSKNSEFNIVLAQILGILIHYKQLERNYNVSKCIRSLLHVDSSRNQEKMFRTFFPVWYNAIEYLHNSKYLRCDEETMSKLFTSTKINILDNIHQFIKTLNIDTVAIFSSLSNITNKIGFQQISSIVDILMRGSFDSKTISKLLISILENKAKILKKHGQSIYSQLIQNMINVCYLQIVLKGHDLITNKFNNMLRNFNLSQFLSNFINGFLYLLNFLTLNHSETQEIIKNIWELNKLNSKIKINSNISLTTTNNILETISAIKTMHRKMDTSAINALLQTFLHEISNDSITTFFEKSQNIIQNYSFNKTEEFNDSILKQYQKSQNCDNYICSNIIFLLNELSLFSSIKTDIESFTCFLLGSKQSIELKPIFTIQDNSSFNSTLNSKEQELIDKLKLLEEKFSKSSEDVDGISSGPDSQLNEQTPQEPQLSENLNEIGNLEREIFRIRQMKIKQSHEKHTIPMPICYIFTPNEKSILKYKIMMQGLEARLLISQKLPTFSNTFPSFPLPIEVQQQLSNLLYDLHDKDKLNNLTFDQKNTLKNLLLQESSFQTQIFEKQNLIKGILANKNEPYTAEVKSFCQDYNDFQNSVSALIQEKESYLTLLENIHRLKNEFNLFEETNRKFENELVGLQFSNPIIANSNNYFQNRFHDGNTTENEDTVTQQSSLEDITLSSEQLTLPKENQYSNQSNSESSISLSESPDNEPNTVERKIDWDIITKEDMNIISRETKTWSEVPTENINLSTDNSSFDIINECSYQKKNKVYNEKLELLQERKDNYEHRIKFAQNLFNQTQTKKVDKE